MRVSLTIFALATSALAFAGIAAAQDAPAVTVVVNGSPVSFDQPPVERAGRVFVPLRGVFEQLGATVVFANGQINATSGRHTIRLSLGSTAAEVDGMQTELDSPPFLIGARTLVPLRFISQALGATVNYDGAQQTVYVSTAATLRHAVIPVPIAPPPAGPIALHLLREEPADHGSIDRMRPEISATFANPVAADSVKIMLDDRDVTANAYVSDRSFVFTPAYDLPAGPHEVTLRGRTQGGPRFLAQWTFASNAVANPNELHELAPANGDHVGRHFTITGRTQPHARLSLLATTNPAFERFADEVTQGAQRVDVTADDDGRFAAAFDLDNLRGEDAIDVRIVSTAPDGSVAVRTLRLRS